MSLRIEEYQRKMGLKLRRILWGLTGYKSPPCPPFLICRGKKGFCLLSLPPVPQSRLRQLMIRTPES